MKESIKQSLERLRGYGEAHVVFHAIQSGLLEFLQFPRTVRETSDAFGWNIKLVSALLEFLLHSGFLSKHECAFSLSLEGRHCLETRGWYELLVGGYGITLSELPSLLESGPDNEARNHLLVASGSVAMSKFDSFPMIFELIESQNATPKFVADLGCGNSDGLENYHVQFPSAKVVGCDRSIPGEDPRIIQNSNQIIACDALEFPFEGTEDFVVLAFLLHEILGQRGTDAIHKFLSRIKSQVPKAKVIIVEVEPIDEYDNETWNSISAKCYYNLYFLLQSLTKQKLKTRRFWQEIFSENGYRKIKESKVDPSVDSTNCIFAEMYVLK